MLIKPLMTEKSTKDAQKGRYTFVVKLAATKPEVKRVVEATFGINVVKIQTSIVPGRTRRTGKRGLVKNLSDWKKALVTVKDGQKIDLWH